MRWMIVAAAASAVLAGCSDAPDAEPAPTVRVSTVTSTTPAAQQTELPPLITMPEVQP